MTEVYPRAELRVVKTEELATQTPAIYVSCELVAAYFGGSGDF